MRLLLEKRSRAVSLLHNHRIVCEFYIGRNVISCRLVSCIINSACVSAPGHG